MISMRFQIMLTKENNKKVNELNNKIVKWMDMYFKEKEERVDFEDKYKITKASLQSSNEQNEELKGVIREMKKRIKDKDKGIEVLKRMLEERVTDEE